MAEGATGQAQTDALLAFQEAAVANGLMTEDQVDGTLNQATIECLLSPDAPAAS